MPENAVRKRIFCELLAFCFTCENQHMLGRRDEYNDSEKKWWKKSVKLKVPTTYWCCVNCPGNAAAWKRHAPYHKKVKRFRLATEDGGVVQQRHREAAERQARSAAQTGDAYSELLAEGLRHASQQDTRRAARAFREAIALRPDEPEAYLSLGAMLSSSGHRVEAAQWFLEAKEHYPVGSERWGEATAAAFNEITSHFGGEELMREECAEVAKPEWWNDEGLKVMSARAVRAAPDTTSANRMRALVLCGMTDAWEAGPRSVAEFKEAATHFDRAAALHTAPAMKAQLAGFAVFMRGQPERQAQLDANKAQLLVLETFLQESRARSAAELTEAAALYDREAALCEAPVEKAQLAGFADQCRIRLLKLEAQTLDLEAREEAAEVQE